MAARRASDRARQPESLIWKGREAWVDEYLGELEALFSPELFITGDGVRSRKSLSRCGAHGHR
jgi:hypothetical protein